MSTPKPTPEQLKQAVLAFARKQIAAGMSTDKVRALLVSKGLSPAAAERVVAAIGAPKAQGVAQAAAPVRSDGHAPVQTQTADAGSTLREFGVQGRFLRLPVNSGSCTLPSVCVVCGADHPTEPVVREEDKHSYGLSTGAASLWACAMSLLMLGLVFPIRGLQWISTAAGLLIFVVPFVFGKRRKKLTLTYTACSSDAATRARRSAIANAAAVLGGLLVVAGLTLMQKSIGDVNASSTAARLSMAAAGSWPWLLLLNWIRLRLNGRLRIATDGKAHAYVDGCSAPFLATMGRLGVPNVTMPPLWSFSPRPGYPVACFWWTFFLLAGGLAVLAPALMTARNAAARSREITDIAHAAGSRPGEYHELPSCRLWVPAKWQLTSKEIEEPAPFRSYRLVSPDNAFVLSVAVLPQATFHEPALDDATGVRMMAERCKQGVISGYKASEPIALTLSGIPAQRMDVSGLVQPEKKGLAAVPYTWVCLQQKHAEYVYRISLSLPSEVVPILGPDRLNDILEWVEPALAQEEGGSDASRK